MHSDVCLCARANASTGRSAFCVDTHSEAFSFPLSLFLSLSLFVLHAVQGCDVCAVDASGSTPLHYAAASGMTKEVNKLVRMGAGTCVGDVIGCPDSDVF